MASLRIVFGARQNTRFLFCHAKFAGICILYDRETNELKYNYCSNSYVTRVFVIGLLRPKTFREKKSENRRSKIFFLRPCQCIPFEWTTFSTKIELAVQFYELCTKVQHLSSSPSVRKLLSCTISSKILSTPKVFIYKTHF